MISHQLHTVLNQAVHYAAQCRHEYVTVEHILLALLSDEDIKCIVSACGGRAENIEADVKEFLGKLSVIPANIEDFEIKTTIGFQRVIQRGVFHVQSCGKKEVLPENVLIAIFSEKDSHAAYYLEKQGLTRFVIVEYVSHGVTDADASEAEDQKLLEGEQTEEEDNAESKESTRVEKDADSRDATDPLSLYTTHWARS
jgi:ATP-dependent Clp protease ATP-binding subunit ClpA